MSKSQFSEFEFLKNFGLIFPFLIFHVWWIITEEPLSFCFDVFLRFDFNFFWDLRRVLKNMGRMEQEIWKSILIIR